MLSVLIMSCDAYEDLWQPFSKLYKKYFPNNYKTYICTETKDCKYFSTIKTTGSWTKRLREALEQIDTEYVFFLLDDFFIHGVVNQEQINYVLSQFNNDTACFNFELSYEGQGQECGIKGFKRRLNKTPYLNSCQPSIHNRLKLIERLQEDQTPWEWELTTVDSPYLFYINSSEKIIDIGYDLSRKPWGVVQGKWSRETKELFDREGISIDYEKRGFVD